MALSFRNSSPRGTVGLDLDGGYLAAVSASHGRVDRAVSAELPAGVMSEGEVVDSAGLAQAVKTFFRDNGLPRNVRLGVANQQIAVRHLELPKIESEDELAAAVRFQAGDAIAMPLDEASLDFQVVGETQSPEGTPRMRLVVVAARQEMIARLVEAVREAGLKPEGIDLDAFALVRALAPQSDSSGEACVYCHLGNLTNLAIAIGPTCLFTRTLTAVVAPEENGSAMPPVPDTPIAAPSEPAPSAAIPAVDAPNPFAAFEADPEPDHDEPSSVEAAALAALGTPSEDEPASDEPDDHAADEPVEPVAFEPEPEPEPAVAPDISALSEEIRLSMDFYMAQADARAATEVVLSGPGAHRAGITEQLSRSLGLPVSAAQPLGRLDASGVPAGEDPYRFTIAAGLAVGDRS